jgi:histone H3/H4
MARTKTVARSEPPKGLPKATFPKKKQLYRPGVKALSEIRKYQKNTHQLIAKLPFIRLIKEITSKINEGRDKNFSGEALEALQVFLYFTNLKIRKQIANQHLK